MMKGLLQLSILVVVLVHLLLFCTGHIPLSAAIVGLFMQALYSQSLKDYPLVYFKSARFVLTCGVNSNYPT